MHARPSDILCMVPRRIPDPNLYPLIPLPRAPADFPMLKAWGMTCRSGRQAAERTTHLSTAKDRVFTASLEHPTTSAGPGDSSEISRSRQSTSMEISVVASTPTSFGSMMVLGCVMGNGNCFGSSIVAAQPTPSTAL
jgi:hypothetical protein